MAHRRGSGRKIDSTHWTGFSAVTASGGLSAGAVGFNIHAAAHLPETLLRTRGNLLAWVEGAVAPNLMASVSVGMILVPEGTGTTVLWSPGTDPDAPWFWYSSFLLGYEELVTDVVQAQEVSSYRETIDSKAMRRVRNQEVQLVVENITLFGATIVGVGVAGRSLTGN